MTAAELVLFFLCFFYLSGASYGCCEHLRKPDHRGHADAVALFLHVADLFRSHAQCGHRRKNWEEVLTKPILEIRMFAVLQAMMVTSRRFISAEREESAAESFSRFFERSEFHTGLFSCEATVGRRRSCALPSAFGGKSGVVPRNFYVVLFTGMGWYQGRKVHKIVRACDKTF